MRAVICGAGIAGLALAQRLACHGWDVTVVERAPGPRTQGYMIDFFGLGYEAAEQMGVLPRMRELAYQIREAKYVDEAGRRRAGLDYDRFARVVDGRLLSIMRPDLELALREQVADAVEIRFGHSITDIENSAERARVTLTDGAVLDADLLVGADGIHSTVRRMVFGDEQRFLRYLGLHTAAYAFDDAAIHGRLDDSFCLTDTTSKMMGFYGLRDSRVAVFAVHQSPDPTLPDDVRAAVRDTYSSLGWVAPDALARCPESHQVYYDQVAQVEVPEWSRGRVTLVGDACQAVSLLAGQGASLAVAGAYVLAEHLATADSVEQALVRYQRQWQPVVTSKQATGRSGIEWFLPSSPTRLRMRRIMTKLTVVPGLDRYVGNALVGKARVSLEELSGERGRLRQATTARR
ncbi:MAG: FAD-dependent oxidoreductase [Pseudonocardiaceae bacterium]|nr:FAD-dependent oxidoreductase [Pseudonocardiaceae bacterium]